MLFVVTPANILLLFVFFIGLKAILRCVLPGRTLTACDSYSVLVTGCDSGFGKATALELRSRGFHVFAGCLTKTGRETLAAKSDGEIFPLRLDVTSDADVAEAAEAVKRSGKPLLAVLNVAGVQLGALVEWSSMEHFEACIRVNFLGMVRICKAMLPLLKQCAQGFDGRTRDVIVRPRIVNVTSVNGLVSLPGVAPYASSKFAAEAFTDTLRWECRPWGIDVVTCNPGTFATPMLDAAPRQIRSCFDAATPAVRSDYGLDYAKSATAGVARFAAFAGRPRHVVDALVDATVRVHPQSRYLVGYDAHTAWVWLYRMPRTLKDAMMHFAVRWVLPLPAALARRDKRRE